MRGWKLAFVPLGLSLLLLSTGCPRIQVRNLEWAVERADRRVPEGSILTGVAAVWVDEDGVLDEVNDDPGYEFEFVSADRQSKFFVDVAFGGGTNRTEPVAFDGSDAVELSPHSTDDLADYIESALLELESIPEDVAFNTSSLDIVVLVGPGPEEGTEEAGVFFYEEADQTTDWEDGLDRASLIANANAYVYVDTTTNDVVTNSWEVSLRRALRLAHVAAGEGYFPVSIVGAWIDRFGELGEAADNPGWLFEFVSPDGLQQVEVTVTRDAAVTASAPVALPSAVTTGISDQTEDDLTAYIAAAVGAASAAGELPETEDILVRVNLNPDDGTEEAGVYFETESDKLVDWATFDWQDVADEADAWVILDTTTLNIEDVSWEAP